MRFFSLGMRPRSRLYFLALLRSESQIFPKGIDTIELFLPHNYYKFLLHGKDLQKLTDMDPVALRTMTGNQFKSLQNEGADDTEVPRSGDEGDDGGLIEVEDEAVAAIPPAPMLCLLGAAFGWHYSFGIVI